jgi:hypothetical protein
MDLEDFIFNKFVVVRGSDPLPGIGQPASYLDVFFAGCVVWRCPPSLSSSYAVAALVVDPVF